MGSGCSGGDDFGEVGGVEVSGGAGALRFPRPGEAANGHIPLNLTSYHGRRGRPTADVAGWTASIDTLGAWRVQVSVMTSVSVVEFAAPGPGAFVEAFSGHEVWRVGATFRPLGACPGRRYGLLHHAPVCPVIQVGQAVPLRGAGRLPPLPVSAGEMAARCSRRARAVSVMARIGRWSIPRLRWPTGRSA